MEIGECWGRSPGCGPHLPVYIFQFLLSNFCFPYAARASLAERLEWKPLINVLDISSRWIWFVPS